MRIEPLEIFVIAFDKDCRSRDRPPLSKPERKVPRTIMIARCLVGTVCIRPNTEVTRIAPQKPPRG
jgi:hypothetical protein